MHIQRLFCHFQVLDHFQPDIGIIMCAVNPHAIHTLLQQIMNQGVIIRGLTGHGNHVADIPAGVVLSEQRIGMLFKQLLPFGKVEAGRFFRKCLCVTFQVMQQIQDFFERGECMRFGSAKR